MPYYKAAVLFKAANANFTDTIMITIEASNAIEAKTLIQDRYGEKAVQSVVRDKNEDLRATRSQAFKHGA